MSLNLDDPLAGILSDGSDDSFFDDDILGKKKTPKKKTTPIAERKSSLFDFGDTEKPKTANTSDTKKDTLFDLCGNTKKSQDEFKIAKAVSPAPIKRSASKESFKVPAVESKSKSLDVAKSPAKSRVSASTDKLDILSEIGSDKKESAKVLEKGKSSQSILDDILGGSTKSGSSQAARPATAVKSKDFDFDSFLGKPEPKSAKNVPTAPKPITKSDPPKDDKKPKQENVKKKSSDDWLGIFQEKDESPTEEDSGMPSWLVGGDSKKSVKGKQKKEEKPIQEVKEAPRVEEREVPEEKYFQRVENPPIVEHMFPKIAVAPSSLVQGSTEDITAEGATLYLQQQESQLMVAMQLKAQEERLAAMQKRQKESQRVQREAALAHHTQLDAMLQKQAEQRQQMQVIIAMHQQRISQRIKSLLGLNAENDNDEDLNQNENVEANVTEKRETPYTREKKQLLQLVQSLQENHDKEIDLMESSYRRQLAFLEVSLQQGEERMKEESDKLIRFYSEKIHWLEDHHQLYKKMTEENLNSLTERHKAENNMIRLQHLENIRILQEHHATLMDNIKKAVKQEQALIQDSASFSSDLHELVTDVKDNKKQCQLLVEKVQALSENTHKDSDRSLQVREIQMNDMIQQLKKERNNFETEKVENREMVKMLETRLKQMTTMIEEDSALLKQKKMEFEFEKATFSKQTEFAKNILKKQDEEIKALRDEIQKEYQDKTTKIEEEKTKTQKDSSIIAKEKASIQSLKQDLEKMKAELEAQLEEVTEERSKLNVEKQQLHMEEQRILAKSRDFDLLAKTTIDKQSQADKKYSEAEFLQRKYEERIRRMQEHVVSLNAREKQIAREKVALSRERLALHNERKQIDNRQQCSLCKSAQHIPDNPTYALPESFLNIPVSRDYRQVDTAMNNIERDIASLMSRNYSLRYDTEIGNSGASDAKFQSADTAQVESEPFKDLMDPKFMMLRLDVQKVLSNLEHSKKEDDNVNENDDIDNHDRDNQN